MDILFFLVVVIGINYFAWWLIKEDKI